MMNGGCAYSHRCFCWVEMFISTPDKSVSSVWTLYELRASLTMIVGRIKYYAVPLGKKVKNEE